VKKIEARAPLALLEELKAKLASAGFTQPIAVTPLLSAAELISAAAGPGDSAAPPEKSECKLEFVASDRQATKLAMMVAEIIQSHQTGQSGHLIVLSVHENYEFGHGIE
jgi:hypothetical protein